MQAQTLIEFGRRIGVEVSAFRETSTECNLIRDVRAGILQKLNDQDVKDLIAVFGKSLTMWIGIADGPRSLTIERGEILGDLTMALQRIARSKDSLQLRIDLRIDKNLILKTLDLAEVPCHTQFYIFLENLIQMLKSPLPDLDSEFFASKGEPTLVLVSDAELYYAGHLLTITGIKDVEQAKTAVSPLSASMRSRIDKYHTVAKKQLSWQNFQFKHLTPLHFLCEGIGQDNAELDSILADHTLHLCILYTANRSAYDGKGFDATYAGSEEIAELSLLSGVSIPGRERLLPRLALWPHGGGERDTNRLTFFQNAIARELAGDSPLDNYRIFVQRLRSLLGEARWHHRVFVDGEIDKHFEQVEKVTDYVAGVIKEISQAIDSLTKGMTEALLGAVGVVVLTLLGTLVEAEVQEGIIKAAIWAYVLYLSLFQGLFRLLSIAHSYRLLRDETEQRLATYTRQLGPKRVRSISSPLDKRRCQFWTWFWATVAIYIAVVALLLCLAYDPRGILAWFGAALPAATPTSTPGP